MSRKLAAPILFYLALLLMVILIGINWHIHFGGMWEPFTIIVPAFFLGVFITDYFRKLELTKLCRILLIMAEWNARLEAKKKDRTDQPCQ